MPTPKSHKVLIGLEIHVQLATASKMFSPVANAAPNFGADPNTLVDPIILGLPGTLPVMNKLAVEYSIMVGLALGCSISKHCKWDRKSYYYPDLPKNYQLSQYDQPLCGPGTFDITDDAGQPHTIRIRRAHLEEDAGKLLHDAPGGYPIDHSIVDLNRAGTPLLEIVTEPDFTTPDQVRNFAQELQKLVQFLGVSQGQMQSGHMRFEPNINLHITDDQGALHKTAITEIKNLNSFSVLERATAYEIHRQLEEWTDTGSKGVKATRGWDESRGQTFLQRTKEDAQDYRYFPDPDLVPVEVSDSWLTHLKSKVGELPQARRKRYVEELGLTSADAATLAGDRNTGDFFERIIAYGANPKRASNLVVSHGRRLVKLSGKNIDSIGIKPLFFAEVANMIDRNELAPSAAGTLFDSVMGVVTISEIASGQGEALGEPRTTQEFNAASEAAKLGLIQVNDTSAIDAAIDTLLATNPPAIADFKAGKQAALGSLTGAIMKSTKGLNPKLVQERLRAKLS
jgi:aspartyl-tRNA(Asn)/glutamyl-tRNA(Gln) amidotransferase subunit B